MKLYFAPNTRAVRTAWLLFELGLDFDLDSLKLGDKSMRSPDDASHSSFEYNFQEAQQALAVFLT